MKRTPIIVLGAALAIVASPAAGQQRSVSSGARITYPSQSHLFSWERGHGFKGGFGVLRHAQDQRVLIVERDVPVYVERETPPPPAAVPLPTPSAQGGAEERKPYVIGATYASLPGGCMKLIEEGVSFFYCSGEWYRQVGEGRSVSYKAVARKL